jgi:hypothetical protein
LGRSAPEPNSTSITGPTIWETLPVTFDITL